MNSAPAHTTPATSANWPADARLARSLTWRYVLALLLLALASTSAWFSFSYQIQAQASTAAQVNISGKQRMFSQRLALLSVQWAQNQPATAAELDAALAAMHRYHLGLTRGYEALNLPGIQTYAMHALYFAAPAEVDRRVNEYLALVRQWRDLPAAERHADHPLLLEIQGRALNELLAPLDAVVTQKQIESERATARLHRIATALWLATLLLLLLLALLVFRPYAQRLGQALRLLQQQQAQLQAAQAGLQEQVQTRTRHLEERNSEVVAQHEQLEQQLHELRIRELALDQSNEGIAIAGPDRKLNFVNRGFERLTGYRMSEVLGLSCRFLQGADTDPAAVLRIRDALNQSACIRLTLRNYRKDGEPFWNDMSLAPVHAGATLIGYVAVLKDVSATMESEQALRDFANHDPLTGLANRRLLADRWEQWAEQSERRERWAAMLYLDLDRFKPLNDTLGHDYGDCLLVQVAQRLRAVLRASDTVARVGGDEFVALLGDLGPQQQAALEQARNTAEKIRHALIQPYELQPQHSEQRPALCWSGVGVSVGVVLFQGRSPTLEALLHAADQAMYQDKLSRRDATGTP